jgi:ectoine hydroxylase-related dioxygenase (phytanoyl-CoA dioxygenase family)
MSLKQGGRMVKSYANKTTADTISATLLQDGGVIVLNQAPDELIDKVAQELRAPLDAKGREFENDFNGYKTLRLGGLLELSRSSAELMTHPLALEIADAVLKRHCENYRIGSCTAIEIHPGEKAQILHRDGDFYPISIPGVEFQIQVMWAMSDFTVENGATRFVMDRDILDGIKNCDTEAFGNIDEAKITQAVMPKGSAFYWLRSTIHGGGANTASTPRAGLFVSYSLGWLRQEENHYLMLPREVADSYPENVRRLIGYQAHGDCLGVYPDDPDGLWWDA